MKHATHKHPNTQRGAALVVGLILLLILTLLAISGMNTSTLELKMAGNTQAGQAAFQAAEIGIERAMSGSSFTTGSDVTASSTTDKFTTTTRFGGDSDVPQGGFSMGVGTGFKAYHFDVNSQGTASRGATSNHIQSFYIVGQAGN
jgi:type IV pilus assembly protein PilX